MSQRTMRELEPNQRYSLTHCALPFRQSGVGTSLRYLRRVDKVDSLINVYCTKLRPLLLRALSQGDRIRGEEDLH